MGTCAKTTWDPQLGYPWVLDPGLIVAKPRLSKMTLFRHTMYSGWGLDLSLQQGSTTLLELPDI